MNIQGEVVEIDQNGKSLVDLVRSTMHMGSCDKAAASVGMGRRSYVFIRKLLILKDRKILSFSEEEKVDDAIRYLEKYGVSKRLKRANGLVDDILSAHWVTKSRFGQQPKRDHKDRKDKMLEARAKRRFHSTLFVIGETCSNGEEVSIPEMLTHDERDRALATLRRSISSLWKLFHMVEGEKTNDQ